MSRAYPFVTVDVFTDTRFGGNQLAVFPDAAGLSDGEMQSLAAEFNLSETTFVLPPEDPANTARVRIFTPTYEMPFAGHPNVGTAYVLAGLGRDDGGALRFEELAGLVSIEVERDASGTIAGATIAAPQPLSLGHELSTRDIAICTGLDASDVMTAAHPPIQASVGFPFVIAEVSAEALTRATPDITGFRRVLESTPEIGGRLSVYIYAHDGEGLRARMFSPLSNIWEDPATGSAATPLVSLLLSLSDKDSVRHDIRQGVEMGRPSLLRVAARRTEDGIRATVSGGCVPVLKGEALV